MSSPLGVQFFLAGGAVQRIAVDEHVAKKFVTDWAEGRLAAIVSDLTAPLPWALRGSDVVGIGVFSFDQGQPQQKQPATQQGYMSGLPWNVGT